MYVIQKGQIQFIKTFLEISDKQSLQRDTYRRYSTSQVQGHLQLDGTTTCKSSTTTTGQQSNQSKI